MNRSSNYVSPMTGVHDIYSLGNFSTMNHPTNVGLQTERINSNKEYSKTRVFGTIDEDIVDTHNNPCMVDNKVIYKKGDYDFIAIQKNPENWSGWFN